MIHPNIPIHLLRGTLRHLLCLGVEIHVDVESSIKAVCDRESSSRLLIDLLCAPLLESQARQLGILLLEASNGLLLLGKCSLQPFQPAGVVCIGPWQQGPSSSSSSSSPPTAPPSSVLASATAPAPGQIGGRGAHSRDPTENRPLFPSVTMSLLGLNLSKNGFLQRC